MRDILFRGKSIDGTWHYGVPLVYTEDYVCIAAPHSYNKKVESITIGQYTGFTDKNGDKIFDSDIVDILTENEEVGFVTYDEGCFSVKADGFSVDFRNNINGNDLLVIGNIHDNPEILKWR